MRLKLEEANKQREGRGKYSEGCTDEKGEGREGEGER